MRYGKHKFSRKLIHWFQLDFIYGFNVNIMDFQTLLPSPLPPQTAPVRLSCSARTWLTRAPSPVWWRGRVMKKPRTSTARTPSDQTFCSTTSSAASSPWPSGNYELSFLVTMSVGISWKSDVTFQIMNNTLISFKNQTLIPIYRYIKKNHSICHQLQQCNWNAFLISIKVCHS